MAGSISQFSVEAQIIGAGRRGVSGGASSGGVTKTGSDTLTNKTMAWGSNTFTGFPFIGNMGNQTVAGNISPDADATRNIGSTLLRWGIGYIPTIDGRGSGVSLQGNGLTGLRVSSTGQTLIQNGGTFTNSGEQLQVVGSTKLDGAVRSTGLQTLTSSSAGIRMFNTSDETTNTEFANAGWLSNVFTISTNRAGTGSIRDMTLFSTGAMNFTSGSVSRMTFTSTSETGGINIGYGTSSVGANIGSNPTLSAISGNQNNIAFIPTIGQSGTASFNIIYASPFLNSTGSGSKNLIDVGTNSAANNGGTHTSRFSVTNTGKTTQSGDLELTASSGGILTKSPNGTRYKITVSDAGVLVVTAAP